MYISILERKLFPNSSPYQHSRRRYVISLFVISTIILVAIEFKIFNKSVASPGKAMPKQIGPWGASR